MNKSEFQRINRSVFSHLDTLLEVVEDCKNIVFVGSIGLLSHTEKEGYYRKIKDIDVIVDIGCRNDIEQKLIIKGYSKSTFIDKGWPFSKLLRRFFGSRCTRFYKSGSPDIEILFSKFIDEEDFVQIELLPFIVLTIPKEEIVAKTIIDKPITTVSPEVLLLIMLQLNKSFDKPEKDGFEKRKADRDAISKIVGEPKLQQVYKVLALKIGFVKVRLNKVY